MTKNIIFYDGYCVVCSRFIRFLIKTDKKKIYSFANIPSKISDKILKINGWNQIVNLLYCIWDKIYKKSDAVIKTFTGFVTLSNF